MKRIIKRKRNKVLGLLLAAVLLGALLLPGLAHQAFAADEPLRYGRSQLSGAALYAYDLLAEQVMAEDPAEVLTPAKNTVDRNAMKLALKTFLNDYPECFWLTGGYEGTISGDYYLEIDLEARWRGATLSFMRQTMETQADYLLKGIGGSKWEMALAIHDRLIEYLSYVSTDKDQTAYGAIVEKKAVCAGYARAYQYLLNRVGIRALTVEGDSIDEDGSERHAWTVFWLDEDVCLYTDVTWDDHGAAPWHRYFAISLETMALNHISDTDQITLPSCGHEGYSYYEQGRGFLLDASADPAQAAAFCHAVAEHQYELDLYCREVSFEDWAADHIRELIEALGYENAYSCGYSYHTLHSGPEYRISLEVVNGKKLPPSETTPAETGTALETTAAPETETPEETTAAPAVTETESAPETSEETESTAEKESTAAESAPAPTEKETEEKLGQLQELLESLKNIGVGAALVIGAIFALLMLLVVLTRLGKKK